MSDHAERRRLFLATARVVALSLLAFAGVLAGPQLRAQTPPGQAPPVPQWQIDAGGKMAFEVASVKLNKCGDPPTCPLDANVSLVPGDFYYPNGGLLRITNWYLMPLIVFAYKLDANQYQSLTSQLPKWAVAEHFDVQARAANTNPTKDQLRLMMQALLAERFKLAVHTESRQLPVFALALEKPGRMGPHLRPHSDDPPCAPADSPSFSFATLPGGYPVTCGINIAVGAPTGRRRLAARNVTMELIGSWLGAAGGLARPLVDETGLSGTFDFSTEWTQEFNGPAPPNFQPDPSGPTFLEALKDQLGLKMESKTGSVNILVIDHVEEPSPN
jgi:uncharacterized protein (TIGR03435 family)